MQELLYDLIIGVPGAEQGRDMTATSRAEAVAEAGRYAQPRVLTEYDQATGADLGEYWFTDSQVLREFWNGKPGVWYTRCDVIDTPAARKNSALLQSRRANAAG